MTLDKDGLANGVLYFDKDGVLHEQKAEIVVIGCNGIGTPRLSLNSKSDRFPDGLANNSGLVGKNLMFHPVTWTAGIFDEPVFGRSGPTGCILWSHEFNNTDKSRGFVRGYMFQATRGMAPAQTALAGTARGHIPWGEGHHEAYASTFQHMSSVVALCEDLPEEHNTVTLDPNLTDSNGIPAPKISYTLSDNSVKMMAHAVENAERVVRAAGATDVIVDPQVRRSGWHLLGTARMGDDPKTSVVNSWGRTHDVKNLFIIDGSTFVTAGAVNPTSTIQALALHIADSIKKNMESLFD